MKVVWKKRWNLLKVKNINLRIVNITLFKTCTISIGKINLRLQE